ncbi:alpha/beta-hydrolase [Hesseltinella vesiculosa]|uniref:Alpha/beta-hydrolase n=1 Tax=Hesseltinella vesiculosa TaxID=101127 RepID=A0A1X2GD29_9FUNG|nr:alpha/beta-hydrolase [Hesseltinella vesiculosa]
MAMILAFLLYILYFLIVTTIAVSLLLYIYQCDILYASSFPKGSRTKVTRPSEYGLPDNEEVLITKDGIKLRCYVLIQPNEAEALRAPTILSFHANAGNMGHRLAIAQVLYQKLGCNVVTLSYRGYGLSEGKANEKGLQIDAQTVVDYIKDHPILRYTQLIAHGQSLGGAVAAYIVSKNEDDFDGLVLENTFLSVPLLIPHVFPALRHLVYLCNQKWRTYKSVSTIHRVPILFLSSLQDELVPPSHMAKLYEVASTMKVWKVFGQGTHNDACLQSDYFETIEEFIRDHVQDEMDSTW